MVEIMEVAAVEMVAMAAAELPIVVEVMGEAAVAVMTTGMRGALVLAAVVTAAIAMVPAT
jgi:hypothetical protein